MHPSIENFLQHLTVWAEAQPDIQAVVLVGSYARGYFTPSSDVDVVMLAVNSVQFIENSDWVTKFGSVTKKQKEKYGRLTSVRVWYQHGLEVEFGITDTHWGVNPEDEGTQSVIRGGVRILMERNGCFSQHLSDNHQSDWQAPGKSG